MPFQGEDRNGLNSAPGLTNFLYALEKTKYKMVKKFKIIPGFDFR